MQKNLTFKQLPELREKTEAISKLFEQQLRQHLETLRPLLSPRRLLGRYVGGNEEVPGAEKAKELLKARYSNISKKPLLLSSNFPEDLFSHLDSRLTLHPWNYTHEARSDNETQTLTLTSPVKWVLSYRSDLTLAQAREAVTSQEDHLKKSLRLFALNALVLDLLLKTYSGLSALLAGLRFEAQSEMQEGLGELPLMVIHACLPSFRPADDLILGATRFSGVPAFIELIDLDSIHNLADPLKSQLEALIR